jgi:hypothetical protein
MGASRWRFRLQPDCNALPALRRAGRTLCLLRSLRAEPQAPTTEVSNVQESKKTMRDLEDDAKEAWRRSDGESIGDKVANAGDRVRHGIEDAGDELHKGVDDAGRRAAYERGRVDEIKHEDDPSAG